MDMNSDGKIDFTEFISAAYDRRKTLSEQCLDNMFNLLDLNGDKKLDSEEIRKILAGKSGDYITGEHFDEIWKQMLKETDKDKSGSIDREEFGKLMQSLANIVAPTGIN